MKLNRILSKVLLISVAVASLTALALTLPSNAPIDSKLVITKNTPLAQLPFWKKKPELMRRMREDRAVLVSVRREDSGKPDLTRFTMAAAGDVKRPKDFCFRESQDYSRLKEISDHFRTVSFDPLTHDLFLVIQALGYEARMTLKILPVSEDWRSELQWQVVLGHFKGMKGLVGFERLDETHTEMSMTAKYEAKEFPLPKSIMGFALEVIMRRVAEKMRTFIEVQPAFAAEPAQVKPKAIPAKSKIQAKKKKRTTASDDSDLDSIHLPPGFHISLFADDVPDAREMALSQNGTLFIGSREAGNVYAIENAVHSAEHGERAQAARIIASGLNEPNGVAFYKDTLYVAEIPRVLRFEKIQEQLKSTAGPLPAPSVLRGDYPENGFHGWRYIAVGPDGWLYVPVGAPCNICKPGNPIYASITRLSLDGKTREIFAHGVRNTVGFDWDPATKQMWFTDNGRDMLGNNRPDDELNHAPVAGLNFGYPYCHQGDIKDPQFAPDSGPLSKCGEAGGPFTAPAQKLGPHVASLGMKFYTGSMFPAQYRGRVFIAEHGSWNRNKKIGYRVSMVTLKDGKGTAYEPFAQGWLQGETAWGRPVDILQLPDGSLLVSDDQQGAIYRISYRH